MALRRILLVYGIVFSFGGIPLVYYGDELALRNDYSYLSDPALKGDNRWMHRPIIDWSVLGTLPDPASPESRIYHGIRKYASIRKESPEFSGECPYEMMRNDNPHVFSFVRSKDDIRTLVVANFAEDDQWIDSGIVPRAGFQGLPRDRITGAGLQIRDSTFRAPALTCLWLAEEDQVRN